MTHIYIYVFSDRPKITSHDIFTLIEQYAWVPLERKKKKAFLEQHINYIQIVYVTAFMHSNQMQYYG